MRKFLVILCSMAMVAGTIAPTTAVSAASIADVDNDGDIINNPFGEMFTTKAPEETTKAPEETTKTPEEETTASQAFKIVSQPKSVEAELGSTTSFTVEATGEGLTYQWQYASDSNVWKNISGAAAKRATYTTKVTTTINGFSYRCIVKDSTGKTLTSDVAKLTLAAIEELEIVSQPKDVIIEGAADATFQVKVKGTGIKYQWQYFVPSTGEWKKLAGASSKTDTFSMPVTKAFDGYKYRCFIKDALGNTAVSDIAYIYAKADFNIAGQPEDAVVAVNDTATFKADITGTGVKYQWQYCSPSGSTWKNLAGEAARGKSYSLKATKAFNGYRYRCVATDFYGATLTTSEAKIVIATDITIQSQPSDIEVAAGGTATFTVKAVGPSLTYQWQYCTKSGNTWKDLTNASAKTATFSSKVTAAFNGYKYRCVITDSLGHVVTTNYGVVTIK